MKTILLTFSATLAAVIFAASVFLNSILGLFGFASIPINKLQSLNNTHQIVEKIKTRHTKRKLNVSKKFYKKSSKRVASSALAAATIGTIAVAVTMASIEVIDYCGEKQELQEDANILYDTNVTFDYQQCLEEGKNDSQLILNEAITNSGKAVSDTFETTSKYSTEKWDELKESSIEAYNSTSEDADKLWDEVKLWIEK